MDLSSTVKHWTLKGEKVMAGPEHPAYPFITTGIITTETVTYLLNQGYIDMDLVYSTENVNLICIALKTFEGNPSNVLYEGDQAVGITDASIDNLPK
jgi:hypothetical protein